MFSAVRYVTGPFLDSDDFMGFKHVVLDVKIVREAIVLYYNLHKKYLPHFFFNVYKIRH